MACTSSTRLALSGNIPARPAPGTPVPDGWNSTTTPRLQKFSPAAICTSSTWIIRYGNTRGHPVTGTVGWMMLDDNPSTLAVVPGANTVYQQHTDGSIWQYTGTPCNSNGCGGWRMLDDNPATQFTVADGMIF